MTPRNGDHVTWRELNLALDPIKSDLAEVKDDVRAMRDASTAQSFLGPRGRVLVNGLMLAAGSATVSAIVAAIVAAT